MRRTMQMLTDDLDRERPPACEERVHFTEALVEAVLTEHTDRGDRVLDPLGAVFAQVARHLRGDGVLVINAATLRTGGEVTPLAWDLTAEVGRHLRFVGETYLEWDRPPPHVSGDYLPTFSQC